MRFDVGSCTVNVRRGIRESRKRNRSYRKRRFASEHSRDTKREEDTQERCVSVKSSFLNNEVNDDVSLIEAYLV